MGAGILLVFPKIELNDKLVAELSVRACANKLEGPKVVSIYINIRVALERRGRERERQ